MSITKEDIMAFTQWQDGESYYNPEDDYTPKTKGYAKDAPKGVTTPDPYDDAPVVDDAYKQDFSRKQVCLVSEGPVTKMVQEFITTTEQTPKANLYARLIYEEHSEWEVESVEGSEESELKELADLVYVIFGYAIAKGWNLDEAIKRVHKNNLERVIQEDGTIKRREDGKILKRENAPKVNLKDLVGQV